MPLFPVNLRMEGVPCVVVGGGAVAERRTVRLVGCSASVRMVSPEITEALDRMAAEGQIEVVRATYTAECLSGARMVFAATNDRAVNHQVALDAARIGAFANIADYTDDGQVVLPAVAQVGDLCIAVSTTGAGPGIAARMCVELSQQISQETLAFIHIVAAVRPELRHEFATQRLRSAALDRLMAAEQEIRSLLRLGDERAALALAWRAVRNEGPHSADGNR